mmetsp:Transcript_19843/g.58397  ORF Transcript_19843/g.58397 Transcript_19843/m.58397 type:complete len:258 (-) Transcript_19843:94-867(-)
MSPETATTARLEIWSADTKTPGCCASSSSYTTTCGCPSLTATSCTGKPSTYAHSRWDASCLHTRCSAPRLASSSAVAFLNASIGRKRMPGAVEPIARMPIGTPARRYVPVKRRPASRPSASLPAAHATAPTVQPTTTLTNVSWMSCRLYSVAVGSSAASGILVVRLSSPSDTGRGETLALFHSEAAPAAESSSNAARLASRGAPSTRRDQSAAAAAHGGAAREGAGVGRSSRAGSKAGNCSSIQERAPQALTAPPCY